MIAFFVSVSCFGSDANRRIADFLRVLARIDYNTPGAYGVIAVAGLMAFITILMMIIYYIFRNEKVIKASSVLFCELIMVGIVLGKCPFLFFNLTCELT